MRIARPGGAVGRVGVPHHDGIPETRQNFYDNIIVAGGRIQPGRVFDRTIDLARVPDGYRANERSPSDQSHDCPLDIDRRATVPRQKQLPWRKKGPRNGGPLSH